MVVVDTLTVEVEAEVKDFKTRLKNVERQLESLDKEAKKTSKNVQNSTAKMGDSFKGLKGALAGAFSVGAIIAFGSKLLSLGSDVQEVTSKFNTVFSGMEEQAQQSFNAVADATGRSRLEVTKFGSDIGDVLKPLGLTTEHAAELSKEMTKLAIDTASFNNVSDAQAINAFRSALTGEREALKSLGIVLTDADIKTKAHSLGINKNTQELSKQEKALITWQLLLENTTDAQGDAIRTMDGYANQSKRLAGILTDTLGAAGQEVAGSTAGLLKALGDFIQQYGLAIVKTVLNTAGAILDIVATAGNGFKSLFDVLVQNTNKAEKDQIRFTTILLHLFNAVGNGFNTVKTVILSAGSVMGAAFVGMINGAKAAGKSLWELVKAGGNLITGNLEGAKENLANIKKINADAAAFQVQTNETTVDTIKDQWGNLGSDIQKSLDDINKNVKGSAEGTAAEYDSSFSKMENILAEYTKNAGNSASEIKAKQKETAKAIKDAVEEQIKDLDRLEKEGKSSYKELLKAQEGQISKIEKAVDEYKTLSKEIEKVATKGAADIQKINDSISALNDELEGIGRNETTDISDRFVNAQKELDSLKQDIKDNGQTSETREREKALEEEIALIKTLTTEEQREAAAKKAARSETQVIIDSYEEEKKQIKEQIELKEKEKLARETELADKIQSLEELKEAKKAEALAEAETLKTLFGEKRKLEIAYKNAFDKRIQDEGEKVVQLTKKYNALAAAKSKAGYAGTVLQSAVQQTQNRQNKEDFNTKKVSDIKNSSVNIYGDITNNNQGDLDSFSENINNQINP